MSTTEAIEAIKVSRRTALSVLSVAGAAFSMGACDGDSPTAPTSSSTDTTTTTTGTGTGTGTNGSTCAVTPEETAGPYPSNSLYWRSDITEGKSGLPLALTITIVNVNNSCGPVEGASVEIWQCDASGYYSEYSQPGYDGRTQSYLRGVQNTDSAGRVTFATIYPGWYQGRATHIHVEVHVGGRSVKTTQIAFPEAITQQVYGNGVYSSKGQNPTTNARDNVFSDGVSSQTATLAGGPTTGYTGTFIIGIAI